MTGGASPQPPIVLLHGFAGSTDRTWREAGWLDLLADSGREVIGLDLLGHGTADHPTDPEAYRRLEDHVLERLPDRAVDVIAFSAGARIALWLAAKHGRRFNRLVVAGLGENLFRDEDSEPLATALESGTGSNHPFVRWLSAEAAASHTDPEALVAFLRRPDPPDVTGALGEVAVPVLVVLGDDDWAGPADPLVSALRDARLVVLRGVDHFATPRNMAFMDAAFDFLGV